MSVIVGNELKKCIGREILITPRTYHIGPGSVDLTLGDRFRTFRKVTGICDINDNADWKDYTAECRSKSIIVMPGELVHGITRETVKLPDNICGRIEGRSRFARLGVGVHVTAGFIQPGTKGQQVLEIANFSPMAVRLHAGTKICQLVFERTDGKAKYKGRFRGQKKP